MPNYTGVIPPPERVMTWLAHGVPLALLADLLEPAGPRSREIYTAEAVADDVRRDDETLRTQRPEEDFSAVRSA